MRSKFLTCLAVWIALLTAAGNTATAAYVDVSKPYYGQYMLIYNPVASGATQYTGVLNTAPDLSADSEEGSAQDAAAEGTNCVDGQAYSQVEPDFGAIDPAALDNLKNSRKMNALQAESWEVGDTERFLVTTAMDYQAYTLTAELMASGDHCDIFVEDTYAGENNPKLISHEQAAAIAAEFDRDQAIMQENFGPYLTNDNDKIVILLHDIKEYLSGQSSSVRVWGYFSAQDYVYGEPANGNRIMMLHIDIPQLMQNATDTAYDVSKGYSTMVHEFQHLINWTDSLNTYLETGTYRENELWMNEMMSMAAEHMIYEPLANRISSFDSSTKVRNGAVLTYKDYSVNGVSDTGANYGLPYLFGQYLRVQTKGLTGADGESGGDGIYKLILQSDYPDYRAVMEALEKIGYGVADFETLQANFRIATVLNENTGRYGFGGEDAFDSVSAPLYLGSGTALAAGAAVVVALPAGVFTPASGATASFMAFSADTEGLSITDAGGDPVAALSGGQTLNISICSFGLAGDVAPALIAGLYNAGGKMVRVWGTGGAAGATKTTLSLTLPADVSNCTLKIFYVNGTTGAPLCAVYRFG